MKMQKPLLILGCVVSLAACTSETPDCSAPETLEVLSNVVDGYISKTIVDFNRRNGVDFSAEVPYSFSAIRTIGYDEASDSYQCTATVQTDVAVTWVGPTNLQISNRQESQFDYRVFSLFDADGARSTDIEYEMVGLVGVPSSTATGLLENQFASIRTERAKAVALEEATQYSDSARSELEDARNNGVWVEEFEIVEKMLRGNVQIPDPTNVQISIRDYGDTTRGSPASCASISGGQDGACGYMLEKYGAERNKWLAHEARIAEARFEIEECSAAKLRAHGSYLPAMRKQIAYQKECRDAILPSGAASDEVSALDRCVEGHVAALRQEIGDDAAISFDQLEEFEAQCVGG